MSDKYPTRTEEEMARRAARKPWDQQLPGDVLAEAFQEWDPTHHTFMRVGADCRDVTLDGTFDLDAIGRLFLKKVMEHG